MAALTTTATPLVPDEVNLFGFEHLPEDYVFAAGHRIGVVVLGSYSGYGSLGDQNRAQITLGTARSSITLPGRSSTPGSAQVRGAVEVEHGPRGPLGLG